MECLTKIHFIYQRPNYKQSMVWLWTMFHGTLPNPLWAPKSLGMVIAVMKFSSVQFSRSVMSDRPPCPSPTPGVYSNPCPLSQWCDPTISSSVVPFSSCPQSFPASGSFLMSQIFIPGGQSIGASASVLPVNIQGWFPLGVMVSSPCCPWDSQKSCPAP